MTQWVISAIALADQIDMGLANEPTTALDMTTEVHYLVLLNDLHRSTGFALVLIRRDLLVVQRLPSPIPRTQRAAGVEPAAAWDVGSGRRQLDSARLPGSEARAATTRSPALREISPGRWSACHYAEHGKSSRAANCPNRSNSPFGVPPG